MSDGFCCMCGKEFDEDTNSKWVPLYENKFNFSAPNGTFFEVCEECYSIYHRIIFDMEMKKNSEMQ
ncbi:MAG: hypothetical protein PHS34_08610 [Candidatus Omnitrophica bacterium]|nr:hypothetical protein [Candidatus Omnitrophota bacterium]